MSWRGPAADRPRTTDDDGFSLIEVLLAVALLSMAVIGVLPAVWGNVRGSALQSQYAAARGWVVSAGEFATASGPSGLAYVPCTDGDAAVESAYQDAVRTGTAASLPVGPGWDPTDLTLTVQYWNGTDFGDTCYAASDLRLQMISLEVVGPDGRATETLDVVKDG